MDGASRIGRNFGVQSEKSMSRIVTVDGMPRLTILSIQLLLIVLLFLRIERLAQAVERAQAMAESAFDMHGRTPRPD